MNPKLQEFVLTYRELEHAKEKLVVVSLTKAQVKETVSCYHFQHSLLARKVFLEEPCPPGSVSNSTKFFVATSTPSELEDFLASFAELDMKTCSFPPHSVSPSLLYS